MKQFIISLLMLAAFGISNAQKYYTSGATITFTSVAPAEKIVSDNKQVTCMVNTATGDIAFKVLMKSFRFEKQGMYDHFNSKYLETDKFPNATFEGKVTSVDLSKKGTYTAVVNGTLTIHGIKKPVKQQGTIVVAEGKITIDSAFSILLPDFGVKVPTDYIKRISNTVQVAVNAVLTPYVR